MNYSEISDIIVNIVKKYTDSTDQICEKTNIFTDLEISSIDLVNIILEIENRFSCTIENYSIAQIRQIDDIIRYILSLTLPSK